MIHRSSFAAFARVLFTCARVFLFALAPPVLLFVLAGLVSGVGAAGVRYAAPAAVGNGDCTGWADACTLYHALSGAASGDEIWVKAGIHKPLNNANSITLKNGVAIYGGFAGTETARSQRDPAANVTVLSGDEAGDDIVDANGVVTDTANIVGDNNPGIVNASGTDNTAVLDGFTITGGQADVWLGSSGGGLSGSGSPTLRNLIFSGNIADDYGGGMYISGDPTLTDVTFTANKAGEGGGMYSDGGSPTLTNVSFSANEAVTNGGGMTTYNYANPTLSDVTFSGNVAGGNGGGMYNENYAAPVLDGVAFIGNQAGNGGGMYTVSGSLSNSPWLTNVSFDGNSATGNGGGMTNYYYVRATMINVTLSGNTADRGGAIYNYRSNPRLTNVTLSGNEATTYGGGMANFLNSNASLSNVILWGNTAGTLGPQMYNSGSFPTIGYSDVEGSNGSGASWNISGAVDDGNNIDADPTFVDAAGGNLRLRSGSPAVDAGNNFAFGVATTDLDGNPRIVNGIVDMGAYEHQVRFVAPVAAGAEDCSSWGDACTLQSALDIAGSGDAIWVQAGVHKPTSNPADPTATFTLVDGVTVLGGFAGTESAADQRDAARNVTVLSGDIDDDDTVDGNGVVTDTAHIAGNNSFHVVVGSGTTRKAVLDGVTITAGQANGAGAGIRGGGMYNNGGSPTLRNLVFSGNMGTVGGGMANYVGSNPALSNVVFSRNAASYAGGAYGGGMANYNNSSPTLTNVSFGGNAASHGGGAMFNYNGSNPVLRNVIMWGDTAGATGAEIGNANSSIPIISYSDIQGSGGSGGWDTSLGTDGGNNIDADPLFVDAAAGNLHLNGDSPARDAGDNGGIPEEVTTDLDGNARIYGETVDMGAYEYHVRFTTPAPRGAADCSSWADACLLRVALQDASGGYEVWVKAGVHKPHTLYRNVGFPLRTGVAVYGGFAGTETARSGRDPVANVTVLSGDIDGNDLADGSGVVTDTADIAGYNSYHVVTGSGTDSSAVLDGVTITAGDADDVIGVSGSLRGGGMYNDNASPTVRNVIFRGNLGRYGGAMANYANSNPALANVLFLGNEATAHGGGMLNHSSSSLTLTNVTFHDNEAAEVGGGMTNLAGSQPVLQNVIIWGNTAAVSGTAIYNENSTPVISYSDVEGSNGSGAVWDSALGTDGGNNIDADPLFVDAAAGNVRLGATSPAVDAGDNTAIPAGVTTDLAGNLRISGGTVDMGAYEYPYRWFAAPAAVGAGDCSGWADACTLQSALALASVGDEIWMKAGVHRPTTNPADRAATFSLANEVAVYGGFAGFETARNQRDAAANVTVLSGDIGGDDATDSHGVVTDTANIVGGNSYHVVTGSGTDGTALLDGVTITAGFAPVYPNHGGGGMLNEGGSPTLHDVTFSGNRAASGGAIYNYVGSSPTLVDVTFSGNAANYGGGIYNYNNSDPALTNVTFKDNTAIYEGGGMYSSLSSPALANVVFAGNGATDGGGMYSYGNGSPVLRNVSFGANTANQGGGMANVNGSTPTLTNVVMWGNTAGSSGPNIFNVTSTPIISYSDVEGSGGSGAWIGSLGTDGGNNIDADPLFADAAGGDLHLSPGSPAVDAGDNSAIPAGLATDLDGSPRVVSETVDMGAFEYAHPHFAAPAASGNDDCSSWADACTLQTALGLAAGGDQIWVKAGVHKPTTLATERTATFSLTVGVAVYGGFAGTEVARYQRDVAANLTVLSGDIDDDDTADGNGVVTDTANIAGTNSYHVVSGSGTDSTALLDGVTITAGQANGGADYWGGGMVNDDGSPTLRAVTFSGNTGTIGGGMANDSGSNPTLHDVSFSANAATIGGGMANDNGSNPVLYGVSFDGNAAGDGGGMYNDDSSPTLYDVTFSGNVAGDGGGMHNYYYSSPALHDVTFAGNTASNDGGGIYNDEYSSPVLDNVTFSGNVATNDGGGMANRWFSSPALHNVTFNGNRAGFGGGMANAVSSSPTLGNVIMWGDSAGSSGPEIYNDASVPTIAYSDVAGSNGSGGTWNSSLGIDGSHNVDADPLFVTAVDANNAPTTAGSLALRPGSPAADSAAATYCPDADIRGVARPQGAACDMGAYERVTLVLAGTATGSNTVELSWTVTGYGPYDLWQSSQPYGGYSATVSGLAGPTHTRNVNGMTFFEVHAEGTGEVSNRVGVVPFVLVPGQ